MVALAPSPLALSPPYSYGDTPAHFLLIPAGLLLLFFGGFVLRPTLLLCSLLLALRLTLRAASLAHLSPFAAWLLSAVVALGTVAAVFETCTRGRAGATGAVLGACIALSMRPAPLGSVVLAVAVLAAAFGLVFAVVRREVAVFLTAYAGGFMVFFGLHLIDRDTLRGAAAVPDVVRPDDLDLWFSVLSFLVVGLLGCAVQLILIAGQDAWSVLASSSATRARQNLYIDIP